MNHLIFGNKISFTNHMIIMKLLLIHIIEGGRWILVKLNCSLKNEYT